MPKPEQIDSAPKQEDAPILLYCPDQGGWQVGVWYGGLWVDQLRTSIQLDPTHWLPVPQAVAIESLASEPEFAPYQTIG